MPTKRNNSNADQDDNREGNGTAGAPQGPGGKPPGHGGENPGEGRGPKPRPGPVKPPHPYGTIR